MNEEKSDLCGGGASGMLYSLKEDYADVKLPEVEGLSATAPLPERVCEDDILEMDEEFNYDGFQVVRREFFAHINEPSVTFNNYKFYVNTACLKRFPQAEFVQVLVNQESKTLAIRPCLPGERDACAWCCGNPGKRKPKQITCKMFFAKVFTMMGWNLDYSMFVPNVHFEQIPIKNLVSNQEYQRNISEQHVLNAAMHFDLCQINPVKVSRRNGRNYVFNGQHTVEIVALASGSRETPVWCMIYDELEYEQEADIFANQMKFVKPLKPYEVFMANIEAGNQKQLIIRDLVESYSLSIGQARNYGVVCAVSTLENIYDKFGYHVLDRTLRLCVGTWEGDMNSLSANMLNGIARLVYTFGDTMKDETFKEKVGEMSVKLISRTAKERRPGSMGYAETMLLAYNRKCKYPLRWTKLYEKNIGNSEGLDIDDDLDESEADDTFEDSAGDDSR